MKILLAVDGSPFTQRMLAYLAAHADFFAATHEYTVLHIVLPVPFRAAAFAKHDSLDSYYAEESKSVLDPIRAKFEQQGIDASFIQRIGHPADEIAVCADDGKYDLVAMGSHGHGAFGSLVLGSVASRVLARCGVPVLLVR